MGKKETQPCCEKFQTMIGGQALIEGIMMRGPEKDAVVVRGKDGLSLEVSDRKIYPDGSFQKWPFFRGIFTFFDAQVTGVKALMRSADLAPEEYNEEPSKFDAWLEKKLGNERFQQVVIGIAVALGLAMSIGLFFLLPMVVSSFFDRWIPNMLVLNLFEGLVRMAIFMAYMILVSRMQEMKRVFSYHGAEHKTIFCYEQGLPLTPENAAKMEKHHPRCGTSFLFVVLVVNILVTSVVFSFVEWRNMWVRVGLHLLILPLIVGITYEFNRYVGRHDNAVTRVLSKPGMWLQNFTTYEPDESMLEVAIAAMNAVIPDQQGKDEW